MSKKYKLTKTGKPSKFFQPCKFCLSPYRRDIESDLRRAVSHEEISGKFGKYFTCKKSTFLNTLSRHKAKHLEYSSSIMVLKDKDGIITKATVEEYAKKVLQIGLQMTEETPWVFEPKDVVAAQEVLLKKKQIELHEDSMRLSMAKLFGGINLIDLEDIQEGEVLDNEPAREPTAKKTGESRGDIPLSP